MKFTNKNHLPDYLYDILSQSYEPKAKRIGVTTLINEPLPHNLLIKHWNELVVDVSDNLFTLKGRAMDIFIEMMIKDNPRYKNCIQVKFEEAIDGWTIVGKSDLYDKEEKAVIDFKVTSVWTYVFRDKSEQKIKQFQAQLNCYAYFWRKAGYDVEKLYLDFYFDDWKKSKIYDRGYPKSLFVRWEVKLWSFEEQEAYIKGQLHYFTQAPYQECSDANKWKSPDTFAIMKKGRKSAVRVFDTREECHNYLIEHNADDKHSIVKRAGSCRKCDEYCIVNQFCPFYKKEKK